MKKIAFILMLLFSLFINAQEVFNERVHIQTSADAPLTLKTTDNSWLYTNWLDNTNTRKAYLGLNANLNTFLFALENGANKFSFLDGFVGIGTSPESVLHIQHPEGLLNTQLDGNSITFRSTQNKNSYVNKIGGGALIHIVGPNSDSLNPTLSLTPTNSVGIGIPNPLGKLHVGNPGGAGVIIDDVVNDVSFRTSAIIGWANNELTANGDNANGTAGDLIFAPRTDIKNTSIRFFTRTSNTVSEKFRIHSSGNIGIGVKTPSSPLHILDNQDGVMTLQSTDDSWIYTNYLNSTGQRKAYVGLNQDLTNYVFKVENGANRFSFMGGAVGINTLNLQPGYQLAVNGNIKAKEIKVETNWSDFVFEDTYKLPTLKEVEQHIEEKGHLKDIPSAKEVKENGIHLGEMDSKLLQKIEELTLYTIQQQKEIEQLKIENIELKKLSQRIDKLEKR